jgi:hypothetical protein
MSLKETIQQAIPGWTGRLACHHMTYLGDGHVHRAVPYNPTDSKVIAKKFSLMQAAGIDMVIATWQGPFALSAHLDATLTAMMCAEMGMQFALLLDPWCAKLNSKGESQDFTGNVTAALQYPSSVAMLNGSSYVPEKYILDFGTGANLTTLGKTFPNYKFLGRGTGFSWINIPPATITDSPAKNAWAVADLKTQHANPAMKVASVCYSFDDSGQPLPVGVATQAAFDAAGGKRDPLSSVWGGPARILESFAGQFGEQQLATIPATVPIIAVISIDDYDEQSSGPLEKVLAEEAGENWAD